MLVALVVQQDEQKAGQGCAGSPGWRRRRQPTCTSQTSSAVSLGARRPMPWVPLAAVAMARTAAGG